MKCDNLEKESVHNMLPDVFGKFRIAALQINLDDLQIEDGLACHSRNSLPTKAGGEGRNRPFIPAFAVQI